jgi:hypothetical protein
MCWFKIKRGARGRATLDTSDLLTCYLYTTYAIPNTKYSTAAVRGGPRRCLNGCCWLLLLRALAQLFQVVRLFSLLVRVACRMVAGAQCLLCLWPAACAMLSAVASFAHCLPRAQELAPKSCALYPAPSCSFRSGPQAAVQCPNQMAQRPSWTPWASFSCH